MRSAELRAVVRAPTVLLTGPEASAQEPSVKKLQMCTEQRHQAAMVLETGGKEASATGSCKARGAIGSGSRP